VGVAADPDDDPSDDEEDDDPSADEVDEGDEDDEGDEPSVDDDRSPSFLALPLADDVRLSVL
jgi:hypothetical protein